MKRLLMHLLLLIAAATPACAGELPQLHDFARMIPLELSGTGALHELPLPEEVYTGSARRDLGDLALFNGAGEIVPFALIAPSTPRAEITGHDLPLFPLTNGTTQGAGGIALQVRTDRHGAIVTLDSAPGTASKNPVTRYVVDASGLDQPVAGFDVKLAPGGSGYVGTIRVDVGDDLKQWREHATGAVATLVADGSHLTRNRVEFPAVRARYFLLIIGPEQGAPRVTAVTARLSSPPATQRRDTERHAMTPFKGNDGDFLVKTGGQMPVDRLRLIFPDENSMAGVIFLSRPDDKSPWIERGCATFYRLRRDATVVESGPLEITPTTDREWLIRIRHPGTALGGRLPQLEIGWQPHRLVFAARGEPPFRLAYGSARTGNDTLCDNTLAAGLGTWERHQIKPQPVRAGTSVEAGGKRALRQRIPATTWHRALLWGALLLGVLLLVRMAWRLTKEMGLNDSRKTDENRSTCDTKGTGEGEVG
jgi:hypothetical protein